MTAGQLGKQPMNWSLRSVSFLCAVSALTSHIHYSCSPNGKQVFKLFWIYSRHRCIVGLDAYTRDSFVASLADLCALLLHVLCTGDECYICQLQGCSAVIAALEHQNSLLKTAMQA